MARNIKYIVVHCTATPIMATVEAIKRYWKEVRKWGDTPGYHYLIHRDGEVEQLLDENKISNGVYGHNKDSVHIAYMGGVDLKGNPTDNRSQRQKDAMFDLIMELFEKYKTAKAKGHRDFEGVKKACPCFDVQEWLANYTPNLPAA